MAKRDAVLSIQSQVAWGYVGNSAAMLPLQCLGYEVLAVNTVQLAHHPGHGAWRGHRVEPARIAEILDGLAAHGALAACAGVISGYLGSPEVADLVLRAVEGVRAARADALFLCDPVIGDDDAGVFVAPGIPELICDRLLPAADLITPNRFELAHLAGRDVVDLESALAAAKTLRARGAGAVIATGLRFPDTPDRLSILADTPAGAWHLASPWRDAVPHGTGDVFSALLLGDYLRSRDMPGALERAAAAMMALVEQTLAGGRDELDLVGAQEAFAAPERLLLADRLR